MADQDKYITVEDGWGFCRTIPADKLELAEKRYEEFRAGSRKAGDDPEITARYTLRIVKEE